MLLPTRTTQYGRDNGASAASARASITTTSTEKASGDVWPAARLPTFSTSSDSEKNEREKGEEGGGLDNFRISSKQGLPPTYAAEHPRIPG